MGGRLLVIGGGLIGGSICAALRKKWQVHCFDLPPQIEGLKEAGFVDEVFPLHELPTHLDDEAVLVLAMPVDAILHFLDEYGAQLPSGTVVTDVGSTKVQIMERAKEKLTAHVHFIGGHPLAGSERSGPRAADPLLFRDRIFIVCPTADTSPEALLKVIGLVEDLGAIPMTMEAEEHDRLLAMLSHVPQLLAMALMHAALKNDETHGVLENMVGQGFLDQTRIAASEFRVWKGILETNRPAVRNAVLQVQESLEELLAALDSGEAEFFWEKVSQHRRTLSPESYPQIRKPDLRQLIDRSDERLLKELGNRWQVIRQMKKLKERQDTPVGDPEREKKLLQVREKWGETLHLSPDLVAELFEVIMRHSRKEQGERT